MKLHKQKVEVGHFQEQGNHSTAGISYVEMMKKHHTGYEFDGHRVPSRMIRDVFGHTIGGDMKGVIKSHFMQWGKVPNTHGSRMLLLTGIGKDMREREKSIFGVPSSKIISNSPVTEAIKGHNSPLVDSGELMEATAYKTSLIDVAITE
jgi:hypothetical protein